MGTQHEKARCKPHFYSNRKLPTGGGIGILVNYDQQGFDTEVEQASANCSPEHIGYGTIFKDFPAIPETGKFTDDFFGNLGTLVDVIAQLRPMQKRPRVQLICELDTPDHQFATNLATELCEHGFDAQVMGSLEEAVDIAVPVVSGRLLTSEASGIAILEAQRGKAQWLPVLFDAENFGEERAKYKDNADSARRVPHILSILNTANRVPPNTNFDTSHENNLEALLDALRSLTLTDQRREAVVHRYLPKFSTLIHSCTKLPSDSHLFDDHLEDSMQELLSCLQDHKLPPTPTGHNSMATATTKRHNVVISHTSSKMDLLELVVERLRAEGFEVAYYQAVDPIEWFDDCDDAAVCLLWLTQDFVEAACGLHSHSLQSQMVSFACLMMD